MHRPGSGAHLRAEALLSETGTPAGLVLPVAANRNIGIGTTEIGDRADLSALPSVPGPAGACALRHSAVRVTRPVPPVLRSPVPIRGSAP